MFKLPVTSAAEARQMFSVTSDGKLRTRDPLHKKFKGTQVKASDRVIAVHGNVCDDPRDLRRACVSDVAVELQLQRDRRKNNQPQQFLCLFRLMHVIRKTTHAHTHACKKNRIAPRRTS